MHDRQFKKISQAGLLGSDFIFFINENSKFEENANAAADFL